MTNYLLKPIDPTELKNTVTRAEEKNRVDHKQYLVNLRRVTRYARGDGGYAAMQDGKSLSIARSRKEEFGDIFRRF